MFSTDNLQTSLTRRGGFAFTGKYLVSFLNAPSGLNVPSKLLSMTCENTTLPTRSIQASDKLIYGTSYQMPYKHAYGEISMTFYLTKDMAAKTLFDKWLNLIVDPTTGDLGYYEDYTCDINVAMFGKDVADPTMLGATADYAVKLIRAWPSIVAEVAMTHSGGGDIARLPITFQYKKWENSSWPLTGGSTPSPHPGG
jgi:hypothetical protein